MLSSELVSAKSPAAGEKKLWYSPSRVSRARVSPSLNTGQPAAAELVHAGRSTEAEGAERTDLPGPGRGSEHAGFWVIVLGFSGRCVTRCLQSPMLHLPHPG